MKPPKVRSWAPNSNLCIKKNQSYLCIQQNLNTKHAFKKYKTMSSKNAAKLCACGSLSENFITSLKTPKNINTKVYIHPKKPPILDYVTK